VTGRLLLVWRLLLRDLRWRPVETVLLLVAITAATGTLTLGLTLTEVVSEPYRQTRAATEGPDVVAEPRGIGPAAAADLAPLTTAPGVTGHSGPFPVAYLEMTARGKDVHAVVEGRDTAPAALDRPAVTDGTWLRPGGVVVERAFADVLGVRPGDTVRLGGHALRVLGIAVTAARTAYPYAGWHLPGSVLAERGGLVWVDRGALPALADEGELSYTLNLELADPAATAAFVDKTRALSERAGGGFTLTTWQEIAENDGRQVARAQEVLLIGSWLLTVLAVTGVVGIVAGRVLGRRRRVGLLKAVGAGPAMVAVVHLAEYLVLGLTAAGLGLAAGRLAAPALIEPSAGLLGTTVTQPPAWPTVVAATALALTIAVAATLVPVVRAATTSTVRALANAATPPRRRRWRIRLSRRLPTALLIGVRINARRPRRARLVMVNTLVTTTAIVAVLMAEAQDLSFVVGASELVNPITERTEEAMFFVTAVLCALALVNAVVNTWAAVLDARQPLAVARTLGATPGQAGLGLAVAQLLPAIPGAVAGIPAGIGLFVIAGRGQLRYAPDSWLIAAALAVLLATTALTAIPAVAIAQRPVADSLRATPA
jgi:putative ABC transport system permease protein